jgi:gamma-glutamylcyclotransferase (GGCT)/AIG2-like uncharacterized protein YtfP
MEIDKIIKKLNQDKNTLNLHLISLQNKQLTKAEKSFIKTFSPEKTLIIYGSLAPNAPNHSIVEHIKGNWQRGIVRGVLLKEGWGAELGYYGFKHCQSEIQEEIQVFVLISDELVDNWAYLDDFEGSGYRRILAKYELKNGQIGVGFIYAINES